MLGDCVLDKRGGARVIGANDAKVGHLIPWLGDLSRQIIALWDMIRELKIDQTVVAHDLLLTVIQFVERGLANRWSNHERQELAKQIRGVGKLLECYQSESISLAVDAFESSARSNSPIDFVLRCAHDLEAVLRFELKSVRCYIVPSTAQKHLEKESVPDPIRRILPQCVFDLVEANRALAFATNTACVYHCMCALDHVLPIIARRLRRIGSTYDPHATLSQTWGNILDQLEKQIKVLDNGKRTSKTKSELKRLSELCAYMRAVKDAWRNDTMHARGQFSEEIAGDVLAQVTACLKYVAGLSEGKDAT